MLDALTGASSSRRPNRAMLDAPTGASSSHRPNSNWAMIDASTGVSSSHRPNSNWAMLAGVSSFHRPNIDASTGVSSPHRPNWVMLDSHVRLNYGTTAHPDDCKDTYAESKNSIGEPVGVWFRTVPPPPPPPGTSRLYLLWMKRERYNQRCNSGSSGVIGRRLSWSYGVEPRVVSAHGNSILLQLTPNVGLGARTPDFFVYTIRSHGKPFLFRLPACLKEMSSDHLLHGGLRHMLTITHIGLLSFGDHYVVADLRVLPVEEGHDAVTPLEAQFCIFRSDSPGGWRLTRPMIRHEKDQDRDLLWWSTDTVVPCDNFLCYVDYLRGILLGTVLNEDPHLLYIRLPVKVPVGDPTDPELGTRGCPHLLRSVCVTQGNVLMFVDIVCTTVFVAGNPELDSSRFAIRVWKLGADYMIWEKLFELQDHELWSLHGYGDLPHVVPEFPLVSMEDPYLLYIVLRDDGDANCVDADTWIVAIDLSNKIVQSSSTSTQSSSTSTEVDGISNYCDDGDMAFRNIAAADAFIPCEFSKYIKKVDQTR
ncbi:hypothetical protein ACQJBY_068243 [Aegilops geniculata]